MGLCRPCTESDVGCTHVGVADQAWCDARCPDGVHDPVVCTASHCFCNHDVLPTPSPTVIDNNAEKGSCRPCTESDVGCTHVGVADQAWCDARCPDGVHDPVVCTISHCSCNHDVLPTPSPTNEPTRPPTPSPTNEPTRPPTPSPTNE